MFVLDKNKVTKIITIADLQKYPFTMWIFGLINILEMQLVQVIKNYFLEDEWKQILNQDRLERAQKLYVNKVQQNENLHLIQCLQIADKITIVTQTAELRNKLGYQSRTKLKRHFRQIQNLRDNIAHAQDLNDEMNWYDIFGIIENCEDILKKLEEI